MDKELEAATINQESDTATEAVRLTERRQRFERIVVLAIFATIYTILLSFFTPSLMLLKTTTAGGDTGAHIYVADYLINHLLPTGRITGWSPGWYAGFPMLFFYFPFPFLAIAALNLIIPFEIAFKFGTVLGIFLLPLAAYGAFRALSYRFPMPIIAAAATLPFLFMESYSIYGANIMSTLAGEFGYSLSFALSILFLAVLYRDIKEQRFRLSTAVLLAILVLSHIVTTMMIVIFSSYYLISRITWRRLGILAAVFGLAFMLTAFWSLPFIDKITYTAHMQWDQLKGLNELFPDPVRPFLALSALGLLSAVFTRDNRIYIFVWTTLVAIAMFFLLPPGRLWNGRVLPYAYFFSFMWAAYGLWFLRRFLALMFYKLIGVPKRYADYVTASLAVAAVALVVYSSIGVVRDWINWNYSGFESKASWESYNEINSYIKGLQHGRVMVEHSEKIDTFGTPRAFELLPYYAKQPTMEGTLMEASISAPFHFVNQAELSLEPSYAILGVKYPGLDVDAGVRHMQLYNIRYFLALTETVKEQADRNEDLRLLKEFKVKEQELEFSLYEVDTQGYVTIPTYKPVLVDTDDWRDTAVNWYKRPELLDTLLIDAKHAPELAGRYLNVSADLREKLPREMLQPGRTRGRVSQVAIGDDSISFKTTAIGLPHLVKISYFPNWRATGADGPYLVSPALMMVIPKQQDVRLDFGYTASDIIGRWLSLLSWLGVIIYGLTWSVRRFFVWRQRRAARAMALDSYPYDYSAEAVGRNHPGNGNGNSKKQAEKTLIEQAVDELSVEPEESRN